LIPVWRPIPCYNNRIRWTASAERFRLVAVDQSPEEYADNLAGQLFDVFGAGVTVNGGAPEFGQVLNRLAEVSADTNGIKAALQCLVNKVTGKPEAPAKPAIDPGGRRLLAGIFERPHTDYPYMTDGAFIGPGYTTDVRRALQCLVNDVSRALVNDGERPVYLTDDDPNVARHTPKTDMTVEAFNSIHGVPVLSLNFEKYSGMYHLWNGDKLVATDASLPEALQNLVNYIWLNWHVAYRPEPAPEAVGRVAQWNNNNTGAVAKLKNVAMPDGTTADIFAVPQDLAANLRALDAAEKAGLKFTVGSDPASKDIGDLAIAADLAFGQRQADNGEYMPLESAGQLADLLKTKTAEINKRLRADLAPYAGFIPEPGDADDNLIAGIFKDDNGRYFLRGVYGENIPDDFGTQVKILISGLYEYARSKSYSPAFGNWLELIYLFLENKASMQLTAGGDAKFYNRPDPVPAARMVAGLYDFGDDGRTFIVSSELPGRTGKLTYTSKDVAIICR
jgi:hypothetical protein